MGEGREGASQSWKELLITFLWVTIELPHLRSSFWPWIMPANSQVCFSEVLLYTLSMFMNSLDFLEKSKSKRKEIKPFKCYYMYQFCVLSWRSCGLQGTVSGRFLGHQGCQEEPLPTESSLWPVKSFFFCFDLVLRRGLTMSTWLVCNSFHRPSWPWTHRDLLCFCPSRAEVTGVCYHQASQNLFFFLNKFIIAFLASDLAFVW